LTSSSDRIQKLEAKGLEERRQSKICVVMWMLLHNTYLGYGVMGLITLVSTPHGLRNSTLGFPKGIGMVKHTSLNIWIKVSKTTTLLCLCFLLNGWTIVSVTASTMKEGL
jgi:hypothetical protein